jgi:ABC-type multidrug transport system ATPase subunit/pSer/pThr/pTyr-binding forkhead associated (FHA) protein
MLTQSNRAAGPSLEVTVGRMRWVLHPGEQAILGRDHSCQVVLVDSRISRRHVSVAHEDGWHLRDLSSVNGMYAEGERRSVITVTAATSVRLADPDDGPEVLLRLLSPDSLASTLSQSTGAVLTIGRGDENGIVLDDMLASRVHARAVSRDEGFDIQDLGSRNGTFVNGAAVSTSFLGPKDLLTIGHSSFTVVDQHLVEQVDNGHVTFVATDLIRTLANGKVLLDSVSFALEGSNLLAVIGPSGSGKSTLLGALTGARPATNGQVLYAGRDLYANYADLRNRIGVVPQDDVVHYQLTVRQSLRFAAELRFPDDLDPDLRNRRVEEVIDELGLTTHANTRVSLLSGGQRKRTSVALELLTQPSLLFLDEPTSGLDPGLDKAVMQTLRSLADGGRTVVVITHSVANLGVCDRVLLLAAGGRVAYFGTPEGVLPFFGASDYADVFTAVTDDPAGSAERYVQSQLPEHHISAPLSLPRAIPNQHGAPPRQQSMKSQVWTLVRRHTRVVIADRSYAVSVLVMPVLLAVLAMAVPGSAGFGPPATPPTSEPMQLLVILMVGAAFMGTSLSARELVNERPIYERERAVGLSPSAYLLAKLAVFAGLVLAQATLLVFFVLARKPGPVGSVLLGSGEIELLIAVAATAFVSAVLGLLISALVSTSEQVMPLLVVSVMMQLVMCGGLIPIYGRPLLAQLSWIVPSRWGYAMGASTANVRTLVPSATPDPLWSHNGPTWILSVLVLAALAGFWSWLVLRRISSSHTHP